MADQEVDGQASWIDTGPTHEGGFCLVQPGVSTPGASTPGAGAAIQNPKFKIQNSEGFVPLTSIGCRSAKRLDLAAIREKLAGTRGRQYWRSLEELAETEEFRQYLEREFPHQAPRDWAPLGRREFMRVMGATLALAGVGGCAYTPPQKIVPYVEQPEDLLPGKPLFYATAFPRSGYGYGLLATSNMGRPTKLEGNPDHPASLGATESLAQGSLLQLYDPDRSQAVRQLGTASSWDVFLGDMTAHLETLRGTGGAGLRLLIGAVTSPTLASQIRAFLALYPQARVARHEPVGRESIHEGARLAFGEVVHPVYHFDRAGVILSLDSDFLLEEPGSVRYAREYSDRRRVRPGTSTMNRMYAFESTPTITGAMADHRLALRPSQIEDAARMIAVAVGAPGAGAAGVAAAIPGVPPEWIPAVVKDLQSHRGTSLVVAGIVQPPAVHALAHAINEKLGNVGKTVTFRAPVEADFGARQDTLRDLVNEINAGTVQTLVILGGNPAYTAPADLSFTAALQKVPLRIHHGLYDDETGILCQWHIPESHYLEAWSDIRAYDGTTSVLQPLIVPLYDTRSAHEVMAVLLGQGDRYGYDIVREYWMSQNPRFGAAAGGHAGGAVGRAGGVGSRVPAQSMGVTPGAIGGMTPGVAFQNTITPGAALTQPSYPSAVAPISPAFESFWYQALNTGFIPGSQAPARAVTLKPGFAAPAATPPAAAGMEIVFRPDPTIWDGCYNNNGWLQELPKPLTTLTWDNAAMISPRTAEAQKLHSGDMVELRYRGHTLPAAILITPGHPDGTVSLTLGYGRRRSGRVGTGTGFNAYALRTSDAPWGGSGLDMHPVNGSYNLVQAQLHMRSEGRDVVRAGMLKDLLADPANPVFMRSEEKGEQEERGQEELYPQMWPSDKLTGGGLHGPVSDKRVGQYEAKGYNDMPVPAWAMAIDLNVCIGCNACTIACQAENNIATVGKGEVDKHRQMHWIRIDHYYWGELENPAVTFEPLPCMQCEKAPCESVCPVEAAVHDAEGINDQVYNRCIGTRYCSNNCPYKVRRFNYLQYSDQQTPVIQLMWNPNVTVRSRGVMEKCTYCVQRINEARIQAEREERPIREGDILTACQQVCPTRAIIFGNLNDPVSNNGKGSEVRQLKETPLNFALLTELNTHPRTSYLAKMRNPNPELEHLLPYIGPAARSEG